MKKKIDLEDYIPDTFEKKGNKHRKDLSGVEEIMDKNKNKRKSTPFLSLLFTIMFLSSLVYVGYAFLFGNNQIKQTDLIINSVLLFLLSFCIIQGFGARREKTKNRYALFSTIVLTSFLLFNTLSNMDILSLPTNSVMKDFTNVSITKALKWADQNKITVEQVYDDSDTVEEYHIIRQNVYPNVVASSIKNVEFTVSSGPDYNKETVIADMTGFNIDEVVKVIDKEFLNNVTIDFETNEDFDKDIVTEQSKKGNLKRNDEVKFKVSLGSENHFEEIAMEDLKDMTEFKATLWLKRNLIKYNIKYEFSNKIKKGHVIGQSIKKGTKVKEEDNVELIVSKGRKIKVPDLRKMNQKDITKWIIENHLKIEFTDKYDMKIKQGKVIDANYKKSDIIEEGTVIKITISKGQLKFSKFSSIDDFKKWADRYGISYHIEYEQNKDVKQGEIISFSVNVGDIIDPNENIIIRVSSGDTIVVPNFIGKKKSEIEKTCKNMNLQCTFHYTGNSNKEKDIALSQNKRAGSEVLKDTYVDIGLSSGKQTSNPNINTSKKPTNNTNNNQNSNPGNTKPNPTPTPKPNCQTKNIYLGAGGSVDQTKSIIQNQNPGFKFNFVTGDPGYGTSGSLYDNMFAKYHGKAYSTCETITIYIVSR